MNKPWVLAAAASLFLGAPTSAQDVMIRSQKDGRQRITTFSPVTPYEPGKAEPNRPLDPPAGESKRLEMLAKNWICGRQFTDADGHIWRLRAGTPETAKPDKVVGLLIRGRDNSLVFVSVNGGVFVPYTPAPGAIPLKKLQEQLLPPELRP